MTPKVFYEMIDPKELPAAHLLDEAWLERLEITEMMRRHWLHLSPNERNLLEAERLLAYEYMKRELMLPCKSVREAIAGAANRRDQAWLREGKGRAVDFKACLTILETYAAYRAWATRFPNSLEILDVLLPYYCKLWELNMGGQGFLRVRCTVSRPRLGKLGEVQWGVFSMEYNEVEFDETQNSRWHRDNNFDPFSVIDPKLRARSFPDRNWKQFNTRSYLLTNLSRNFRWLQSETNDSGRPMIPVIKKEQLPIGGGQSTHNHFQFELPETGQVQEIMDGISQTHHPVRWPPDAGHATQQIQFDVEADLSEITAACVIRAKGPFEGMCGSFYRTRENIGPLNPPKK